jgi:hypothetical protein
LEKSYLEDLASGDLSETDRILRLKEVEEAREQAEKTNPVLTDMKENWEEAASSAEHAGQVMTNVFSNVKDWGEMTNTELVQLKQTLSSLGFDSDQIN